jgi:hypothetical protein
VGQEIPKPKMMVPDTVPIHHSLQWNSTTGEEGTSPCGQKNTPRSHPWSSVKRTLLRIRLLLPVQLLIQLIRETRNFHHRISAIIRTRGSDRGVDMGRQYHKTETGRYLECSETRARIEDTLHLSKDRPWLTCLDYSLFVEGWNMGARFHSRSSGVGNELPCRCTASDSP